MLISNKKTCEGINLSQKVWTTQFYSLFIYLFIYLLLCWVFVSVRGLSLVAASGGHSTSRCMGLSLSRPLLLWSTGSRRAGSAIVAHRPSRSMARGIFPAQGSNPCPLYWQADSQPLRHQGSPEQHSFELCGYTIHSWVNPRMWNHEYGEPTIKLYSDFWLCEHCCP